MRAAILCALLVGCATTAAVRARSPPSGAADEVGIAIGGEVRGRATAPVAVEIGEASFVASPIVVARATHDECGYDGVVGTDVLRHCSLFFARNGASIACSQVRIPRND